MTKWSGVFIFFSLALMFAAIGHLGIQAQPNPASEFSEIRGLALHPFERTLAIGGRYNDQPGIWFYDLLTQTVTGIPTNGNVASLFWRPDGQAIAAVSSDEDLRTSVIRVYDLASQMILFEFLASAGREQVIWSADGSRLMELYLDRVRLREGVTGSVLEEFLLPESNGRSFSGIAWSEARNRLYTSIEFEPIILEWSVSSNEILRSLNLPFASWGGTLSADETRLAVGSSEGDGTVLILDTLTGGVLQTFNHPWRGFIALQPVWSPNMQRIAVYSGYEPSAPIAIWDVNHGEIVQTIPVENYTSSDSFVWDRSGQGLIFSDGQTFPVNITPPTADAGMDQIIAVNSANAQVILDGSSSEDVDGEITSYTWLINGIAVASGTNPTIALDLGVHEITLIVTDNDSATGIDQTTISVTAAPTFAPTPTFTPTFTPTPTLTPTRTPTPTATPIPLPPADTNLLTNPSFASGLAPWQTVNFSAGGVVNGVLEVTQPTTVEYGVVWQSLSTMLPANTPMDFSVALGNSSAVPKRVQVILRTSDWAQAATCEFVLPANSPLAAYSVRVRTAAVWGDILAQVWTFAPDGLPAVRIDSADLQYRPALTVNTTPDCLNQGGPILVNGPFEINTAGWSYVNYTSFAAMSGQLQVTHPASAPYAAFWQELALPLPSGRAFEFAIDLSNTTGAARDAQLIVRGPDWNTARICAFNLPGDGVSRRYTLRGTADGAWSSLFVQVWTFPGTTGGTFRADNAAFGTLGLGTTVPGGLACTG